MSLPHLPPVFARALAARGYNDLTPVQAAVLAPETDGRDLLVSAQTGSGKTVAYGMAMAEAFLTGERVPFAEAPLALIIAPTRELALQVQSELTWLYAETGARIAACVGGMDPIRERRQLERGAHIVVGTPGRLRDHMERGALDLSGLAAVVLDEADEMLDLGFSEDLHFILDATPPERRTFLFSATLPRPIVALAKNYQNDAFRIEIAGEGRGHADIEYRAIKIAHAKIDRAVVNVLRAFDPACALVFCATRLAVQRLNETLAGRGFACVALSGEMTQAERNRALSALRDGRAKVCVATDVAARGLDVPGLTLVIHAELPKDAEILQHRSGRTGRAGKKGTSILFVPPSRRRAAESLLQRAEVQYSWDTPPSAADIVEADRARLLESPLLTEPGDTEDAIIAAALMERFAPHQIAAALAKLYRASLPVPEDLQEYVEDARFAGREERHREERDGGRRDDRRGDRREPRRDSGYDPRREDREPRRNERREDRGPRRGDKTAERHALSEGVAWFRISVGRERNADPKWLLPEICRQGEVTKKDIGEIRIFDRETRFQLDARLADDFAAKIAARSKGGVMIMPTDGGEPAYVPPPEDAQADHMRFEKPRRHDGERKPRREDAPAESGEGAAPAKNWAKKPGKSFGGKTPWEKKPGGKPPGDKKPYGEKKAYGEKPSFGGKKPWAPKDEGKPFAAGAKTFAKKPGKKSEDKKIRFSEHQADEERRAKRKERKKEKRKLAAIARGDGPAK